MNVNICNISTGVKPLKSIDIQIVRLFFLIRGHLLLKSELNHFLWSKSCLLFICSFMDLREHKNAIQRFIAIVLGSLQQFDSYYYETSTERGQFVILFRAI